MSWPKARDDHGVVHLAEATPDLITGRMRPYTPCLALMLGVFVPRGTPVTCLWCAARGSP